MFRAAEPKENPFQTILRQYETKLIIPPTGKDEALAYRGWYVLGNLSVSRSGDGSHCPRGTPWQRPRFDRSCLLLAIAIAERFQAPPQDQSYAGT